MIFNSNEFLPYQFTFILIIGFLFYILFYYGITDNYLEKPNIKDILIIAVLHLLQIYGLHYLYLEKRFVLAYTLIIIPAIFYGLYRKYKNKQKYLQNLRYWDYVTQQKMQSSQHYDHPQNIPPNAAGQQPNFNPMLEQPQIQMNYPNMPGVQQPATHVDTNVYQQQPHTQQYLQPHLSQRRSVSNAAQTNSVPASSILDNTFYEHEIENVKQQDVLDYADIQSNNMNVSPFDTGACSYQNFSSF